MNTFCAQIAHLLDIIKNEGYKIRARIMAEKCKLRLNLLNWYPSKLVWPK